MLRMHANAFFNLFHFKDTKDTKDYEWSLNHSLKKKGVSKTQSYEHLNNDLSKE
ncbi:hypothetical protein LguiA_001722 [Lonicera macranthoides]